MFPTKAPACAPGFPVSKTPSARPQFPNPTSAGPFCGGASGVDGMLPAACMKRARKTTEIRTKNALLYHDVPWHVPTHGAWGGDGGVGAPGPPNPAHSSVATAATGAVARAISATHSTICAAMSGLLPFFACELAMSSSDSSSLALQLAAREVADIELS